MRVHEIMSAGRTKMIYVTEVYSDPNKRHAIKKSGPISTNRRNGYFIGRKNIQFYSPFQL